MMIDDWTRKRSPKEEELMIKYARLGRRISIGVSILASSLLGSYILTKVFIRIIDFPKL